MIKIKVIHVEEPTSLLAFLRQHGVSSTMRRKIKHNGVCTVNGITASWKDFVHPNDVIIVRLPEKNQFEPENIPIRIRYEDEYLLVVDKPAGLLMHPTSGSHEGTLANAVSYYYQQTGQSFAYHPMHRLDRNTSGLTLIAKQPQIQYAFDKRELSYSRQYLAIVTGNFPYDHLVLQKPISRCPDSIIKRMVHPEGKFAQSEFTRLAADEQYSLLSVSIQTGRTHQIRVHCSYLGYPLIGDDLYGGTHALLGRQALHAYCMQFRHPVTDHFITVTSPLPLDMYALISNVGWDKIVSSLYRRNDYAISNNKGNV